jgi:outer membrane protein assembly factor BamD (BamD/ComL family)
MQRARTALRRGDASAALAELDQFGRGPGWRQLAVEARLLRIEALARAGRAEEARNLARRFVQQYPNNPLVDRARSFVTPAASSGGKEATKESRP